MKSFNSRADGRERILVSVKEASEWLGISVFTLYSWALAHRIPHYKIGKRVMFSKEDLQRWLAEHRVAEAG
jgi:excisionase family DNA binding protein